MPLDPVTLTRQLVALPSYNDRQVSDKQIAEHITALLHTFPSLMRIFIQDIGDGRFNVIAMDDAAPTLAFACHLDTVEPRQGWKTDPLVPTEIGDRMYALGAKDMKGGTASLLAAVSRFKKTRGLCLLFYVDEEYGLRGMRKLAYEYVFPETFKPEVIVSPESSFKLSYGRRGMIGLYYRVRGLAAHSARPQEGKNAIQGAVRAYERLAEELARFYEHPELGHSVPNLAYVHGGGGKNLSDGSFEVTKQVNVVPDVAEVGISIRTAIPGLNAEKAIALLRGYVEEQGMEFLGADVIHDYGASYVDRSRLARVEDAIRTAGFEPEYKDAKNSGYNDVEMLATQYDVPFTNFGPAGDDNHMPNEWVSVQSLRDTEHVFTEMIRSFCKGEEA